MAQEPRVTLRATSRLSKSAPAQQTAEAAHPGGESLQGEEGQHHKTDHGGFFPAVGGSPLVEPIRCSVRR